MKIIQALIGACVLLGCSNLSSYAAPNDTPPSPASDPQSIPVYEGISTPPGFIVVGPVTATSCKQGLFNGSPVKEKAIAELRVLAFEQGANAVGNVNCVEQSFVGECYSSIVCTGSAINLGTTNAGATTAAPTRAGVAKPPPTPAGGKTCAAITAASERLACYDSEAKRRR